MSKIVKIYCEGISQGHDREILEKVINGLPQIQIEPIGSIRGAGAIIQYKEKNEVVKSSFYLLYRDRDFDKPIPDEPQLEVDSERKYCFFSYRNTIENYLFNINHFYSFIKEEKLIEKYNISNEEDIKSKFIEAAEQIKYYQAVRHTLGKMRTGETNFGTKLTDKSGKLPSSLDEKFCKSEGISILKKAKTVAEEWTEENFEKNYSFFISKFNSDFIRKLDFLVHFHGKDFAAGLKFIFPDFPIEKYYKYAKKHFDYTIFADLVELRKLIVERLR